MTYQETIQYLNSFINYENLPEYRYNEFFKLERIKEFLESIGNPQEGLNYIHIAGTKGKGSTCAFVAYILRESGYRVGLYTSPHLSDFRERIRILGPRPKTQDPRPEFEGMISEEELADLVERSKPEIEKYNQNSQYGPLSFFEVYTSLAYLYFKEKKVDFVVLETGLGGRLDATNVVNPLVCAITSISYDHTDKLGSSLKEIAQEKAGIIKAQGLRLKAQGLIVISAPQDKEVLEVIRNKCKETGAKLYGVNKDIFYEKTRAGFNVLGIFGEYPNLKIRLLGEHQLINATVAVGVIEALRHHNIYLDIDSIREGLYNTLWPGRCEVIAEEPLVVLDGAQNAASIQALKEAVKANFKFARLILVLGISKDKDVAGVCKELQGFADNIILTKTNNPRATEPEKLAQYFDGQPVQITQGIKEAETYARRLAKKEDLILFTGSLFVVGEARTEVKS